jgi:phytoene synthase
MILNGGQPVETGDAAGHLGVAQALVGHLRAFGYNAAHGRIFLPWSIFAANGAGEQDVLAGRRGPGIDSARRQLIELARDHAARAKAAIAALPKSLRPAFIGAALLAPQIDRLERPTGDPFALPPDLADWRKLAILAWHGWRGR